MLKDLSALTPPAVVCAAFLAAVIFFLRRQMGVGRRGTGSGAEDDIPDDGANTDGGDRTPASSADRRRA